MHHRPHPRKRCWEPVTESFGTGDPLERRRASFQIGFIGNSDLNHLSPQQSSRDDHSIDEVRNAYSSGWQILVQHERLGYILDVLMDAVPEFEFTKPELASEAGLSGQSPTSIWIRY